MTTKTIGGLAVAAFLISAIALITVAFRIEIALTNDTWVGIIATLIGAAATLIVGIQIYSSISTKKDIKEIRSLQDELREQQRVLQEELKCSKIKFRANHFFAQGLAVLDSQPFSAFYSFLKSAELHLKCNEYQNCNISVANSERRIHYIQRTKKTVNTFDCDDSIDEIIESMRQCPEYNLIKDRVEKIAEDYKKVILEVKEAQNPAKSNKS